MKLCRQHPKDQQVQMLPMENLEPTIQQKIQQAKFATIRQLLDFSPTLIAISRTIKISYEITKNKKRTLFISI